MIRFVEQRDFPAVVDLWNCCFPGDETFTAWFFAHSYRPEVTLVDEEDGVLCSMLQMLPYQLHDMRGVRPVTYIYGACTAPACRRQHRMDRLLARSFELDRQAGRAASVLIPQEEWLFDFYDQFGYQTAFYTDSTIVSRADTPVEADGQMRRLTEADIPALRALCPSDGLCLLRTDADWQAQLALFDALGYGVYGWESAGHLTAYAFVWQDGPDKLWAQEICGAHVRQLAQSLLRKSGTRQIRLTGAGMTQKLGCIRYHDDTPVETGYFNLLFN